VGSELERIGLAVLADLPGFRDARYEIAVRRLVDEPLEKIALNVRARYTPGLVGIERSGIGIVAPADDLLVGEFGTAFAADGSGENQIAFLAAARNEQQMSDG